MAASDKEPVIPFASAGEWEEWLHANHDRSPGIWMRLARRGVNVVSVTYAEAVDVALCHGWIDGQKGRLDESFWLQRFTPRGPKSRWSAINRARAMALMQAGRMTPAALAQVARAQADGRWEHAYAGQRAAAVPDDLRKALEANPQAAAFFASLDGVNRYAVLYRVQGAKRPATRERRIAQFVDMLNRHETLHPMPSRRPRS